MMRLSRESGADKPVEPTISRTRRQLRSPTGHSGECTETIRTRPGTVRSPASAGTDSPGSTEERVASGLRFRNCRTGYGPGMWADCEFVAGILRVIEDPGTDGRGPPYPVCTPAREPREQTPR